MYKQQRLVSTSFSTQTVVSGFEIGWIEALTTAASQNKSRDACSGDSQDSIRLASDSAKICVPVSRAATACTASHTCSGGALNIHAWDAGVGINWLRGMPLLVEHPAIMLMHIAKNIT